MSYPLTAILSDLHGNWPALRVALADARERGAQRYVCLGDVVGYGARPLECLERVMQLCGPDPHDPENQQALDLGLCLQGNHELALLSSAEEFNPKARAAIDWTRQHFERIADPARRDAAWDFLGALVPAMTDGVALFVHGSPRDPVREYMLPRDSKDPGKLQAVFACMRQPICFVGHSHVPAIYYPDGQLLRPLEGAQLDGPHEVLAGQGGPHEKAIVNVGSVGQPRDGDPRLSYVLFDGQKVSFVRLAYPIEEAQRDIRAVPELPPYLAERLAVGR